MKYYVYMLKSRKGRSFNYVGWTNNLEKRLKLHNTNKGAKFTKGKKWRLVYYKKYESKISAMKEEYKLKKNYNLRSKIKKSL